MAFEVRMGFDYGSPSIGALQDDVVQQAFFLQVQEELGTHFCSWVMWAPSGEN